MTKINNILETVKKEGYYVGKLSYADINILHNKGVYCLAVEGGKYKVEDWDNILKDIINQ